MHVVFLGTGGFHPTDERQTNCILFPEAGIVLDAGTGFQRVENGVMIPCIQLPEPGMRDRFVHGIAQLRKSIRLQLDQCLVQRFDQHVGYL